jgi:hypothetical protein
MPELFRREGHIQSIHAVGRDQVRVVIAPRPPEPEEGEDPTRPGPPRGPGFEQFGSFTMPMADAPRVNTDVVTIVQTVEEVEE